MRESTARVPQRSKSSAKSKLLLWASCVLLACLPAAHASAATCDFGDSHSAAARWFQQYDLAWEHRDAAAATALFAQSAVYREDPFEAALQGAKAIRGYWDAVARGQRDVRVSYRILSVCGNVSIVHWRAGFIRTASKQKVRLDGIAEVTLDAHGKCALFREWWDRDQT